MSDIWAVIPVKEFDGAKDRLFGQDGDDLLRDLIAMLANATHSRARPLPT